jgi:thiosulfate/3-mercaptopyruvate sulfurtransferase
MDNPGPLVTNEWLAAHLGDSSLRLIHVGLERDEYDRGHIPGATWSDLHVDLAKGGTRPDTGSVRRQYLLPTLEETAEALAAWGVGPNDRVVFYDGPSGRNRQAARGYWLLRLYRFPQARVHVLDGGLTYWTAQGGAVTQVAATGAPVAREVAAAQLGPADASILATAEEVLRWSAEAAADGGPTRLLDVRTIEEFLGRDVRASRGGRIAGSRHRLFSDFVAPDGRLRSADEAQAILRGTGVEPDQLRATYCQGGIRAALVWFVFHELAGLSEVRNYAESWEEWGNRPELPIEK